MNEPMTQPISPAMEARGLAIVLGICFLAAAIGIIGNQRPGGWLRWDNLDRSQSLLILNQNLTGGGCVGLMPQAQVNLDGQYAEVVVPGMGVFEVQTHHVGIHTVRAVSPITDLPNCRFDPRYVGPTP